MLFSFVSKLTQFMFKNIDFLRVFADVVSIDLTPLLFNQHILFLLKLIYLLMIFFLHLFDQFVLQLHLFACNFIQNVFLFLNHILNLLQLSLQILFICVELFYLRFEFFICFKWFFFLKNFVNYGHSILFFCLLIMVNICDIV